MLHIPTTCSASGDGRNEKQQKIDLSSNNEENLKFKLRYQNSIRKWPKFSSGNAVLPRPYPATSAILHNFALKMDFSNFSRLFSTENFHSLNILCDGKRFSGFPQMLSIVTWSSLSIFTTRRFLQKCH